MNKGPDAFRTISEVAEDLDIPQHVLRFWETRFTSIRPLKRGGGRRYYRPDDVELLKGIRQLLYGQGYTIKGVQRILKEDGLRFVQGVGRGETLALPLPAEADDDLGAEEPEPGAPERASASREADEGFAAEPSLAPAPGRSQALSGRERDLLRAALDELLECQRALETLRRS